MSDYSLKRYFDGGCATAIGERLLPVVPDFDVEGYAAEVNARVGPLELKDRVLVLAQGLKQRLPEDYPEAVRLIVASLGPELGEGEGMFSNSWYLMPVARFVEEFGLDHPQTSLRAIKEITRRHTGEFAIRPYLQRYLDLTMAHVREWAADDSHNVRRLASEGIRPRLPWAARFVPFVEDPRPVVEVIDRLIDDPSLYVRKSVANNLNDIAKDHPTLAVATARRWLTDSETERTKWIVRHGLRTLIKAGDGEALAVIGSEHDPALRVENVRLDRDPVAIGESVTLHADIVNGSTRELSVIVDYELGLRTRSGSQSSKTFKLTTLQLPAGQRARVSKRHHFRVVRTRNYWPGRQSVLVKANGIRSEPVDFELVDGP